MCTCVYVFITDDINSVVATGIMNSNNAHYTACPWVQELMRPSTMPSMLLLTRELTLVSQQEMTMAVPAISHQPVLCIGKSKVE